MIILLILITYLLTVYVDCLEKFDLGHYWDLKGYSPYVIIDNDDDDDDDDVTMM